MRSILWIIVLAYSGACSSSRPGRPNYGSGAEANPRPVEAKIPSGSVTDRTPDGNAGGTRDIALNVVDTRSTVRMSSADVLINKLKVVAGLDESSAAVVLARKSQLSLGSYNFAQGVLPESHWTIDKMGAWFKVIDQACRDPKLLGRIRAESGEKLFIEAAYGRDIIADETTMLSEMTLTGERRARVLCTAVLSSGEFVAL
jgi:hypothetical protein